MENEIQGLCSYCETASNVIYQVRFAVAPCLNLFQVMLVLKRTVRMITPGELVKLSTTGSFKNQHYSYSATANFA